MSQKQKEEKEDLEALVNRLKDEGSSHVSNPKTFDYGEGILYATNILENYIMDKAVKSYTKKKRGT